MKKDYVYETVTPSRVFSSDYYRSLPIACNSITDMCSDSWLGKNDRC